MSSSNQENSFKIETRDRSLSEIDESKPPIHVSKHENREIRACEALQSDMATKLEVLEKSNKSLIWMMEKMTLAADKTELINREKLEKANNYIAELEEDLSSSKKMWADFEMMTTHYENEMKKKMEELENLKMDYQKMEMQWKEEITKRDEEIEMQKKEIETLRNEKAAVQISTANRTIGNNQLIDVGQAQNIENERKKYVVVVYDNSYEELFEASNVVFVHFGSTNNLKDYISENKASYHKEMFIVTNQYNTTQFSYNLYFNLMSICQQWKTFYPDAEIHVIGLVVWGCEHDKPAEQMRQLWTSYNSFKYDENWRKTFTGMIARAWTPHCYRLLSGEMKQLYLQ